MSYNLKLDSSDFKKLLAATYGLHDADVSSITFDSAARKLRIEISFIHWGTDEGLILVEDGSQLEVCPEVGDGGHQAAF